MLYGAPLIQDQMHTAIIDFKRVSYQMGIVCVMAMLVEFAQLHSAAITQRALTCNPCPLASVNIKMKLGKPKIPKK